LLSEQIESYGSAQDKKGNLRTTGIRRPIGQNKLLECANGLPLNTPMGNAPSSAFAAGDILLGQ
jgi:hypothetical protein